MHKKHKKYVVVHDNGTTTHVLTDKEAAETVQEILNKDHSAGWQLYELKLLCRD